MLVEESNRWNRSRHEQMMSINDSGMPVCETARLPATYKRELGQIYEAQV